MHTWLSTQSEGWWRLEFDRLKIPYEYISTQTASKTADLRAKYDVIVFAPGVRGNPQTIVSGMPMYGNPLPWKVTQLTPNLGKTDETDDMRPGLGWAGVEHLQEFVNKGGLLITANDTTNFAGVRLRARRQHRDHHATEGDGLGPTIQTGGRGQPIAYGYRDNLAIFASTRRFSDSQCNRRRGGAAGGTESAERPTGRGTPTTRIFRRGAPRRDPRDPHAETWEPRRLPTSSFATRST
jgi:hypothetical protein